MPCISCGKDSERYHKSFVKASKGALRVANAPVYPQFIPMLPSILEPSRLVKNWPSP